MAIHSPTGSKRTFTNLYAFIRFLHGGFGVLEEPDAEIFTSGSQDLVEWVEVQTRHFL